ncbi:lysophospholipid acyltransferase family protein [Thiorhodovibrio frisius]|uniref:1-acyl-sn-glycerol-3-phosphate acyltransferase n=1 Tax=Thiorhodovibrio frisius TaxID=631362 RepID=H8Z7U5_9GAMM|nr:lysophospholipid acyltransferase family protein [Thiorhodovibrio frisius]EIC20957.1 1-acyl-sn-glycerol-3-phosphate acyltransferase [Thiorhodovibrio frisius]WPL22016.1 2-acyl-glycerophospho-ethanolamine acyltransferase [Thiorhodovibrio frisius]
MSAATSLAAGLLAGLTRLITGVRARWVCTAPSTAARVYFANHASHLDTLVIWASLPKALRTRVRPVAAADYWGKSRLRRWLATEVLNALLVERSGGSGSREALHSLVTTLKAGDSLILFPEGTRGDGSAVGALRPGLYFVAEQCPDVELIPVHLHNLSRILPKGELLPVPIMGSATFGAPMHLRPGEHRDSFLNRARAAILDLGEGQ